MAVKDKRNEYFDELETMTPEDREKYHSQNLSAAVQFAYRHSPAAKAMIDRSGIRPDHIQKVRNLEKLPITRKNDLIDMQRKDPPYGSFLTIPPEEVDRVFISPGPVYEPIHHQGIKWFTKAFWAAGFRKGDVVVNTFTYHLSPAGILFHEAIRDCGATAVPTGTGNTEIQLQTMRHLQASGYVGTPSFLMSLIKRAEEMGLDFKKDYCLRRAWFTGEMLAPSVRQVLEYDYEIDTYQAYGVTECGGALAYECRQKKGMHLMDEYIIEIVDPETGRQLGPREVGEVVVTPLHNRQWGLIRFGTGDLSAYITEPCPCGRTASRLTGIMGRAGDAVKVRGMFVVAQQAEQVCLGFEPVSRFQIEVGRHQQRDEMVLRIELKREIAENEKRRLAGELAQRFQATCRLKPDRIDFVPQGTIAEDSPKIADRRRWA
jgi:phenylacetate-CoA ligase